MNSSECATDLHLIITGRGRFDDVLIAVRNSDGQKSMTFSINPYRILEVHSRLCWKGYYMDSIGCISLC